MGRQLSSEYSHKHIDHATDAFETASKRTIQKTTEATADLIGNNIANKITRSSKASPPINLETNEEILDKNIYLRS